MPVPKTSGFLNNCGVNGGLHIIIKNLKKLAYNPYSEEIPDVVKVQYYELLNSFDERYKTSVTYSTLVNYLESLENNTARQIVMGPVLRDYMKKNGASEELTSIHENGRYIMLTAKEVSDFAYAPLGISIESTNPEEEPKTLVSENEIDVIHYHLENLHFQASTPDVDNEKIIEDRDQLYETNPGLAIEMSIMDGDKSETEKGLEGICQIVQTGIQEQINSILEQEIVETIPEQARLNYVDTMASFKKLYQEYTANPGFFAKSDVEEEQVKEFEADEVAQFASKEKQEEYDEKLAIQLQKKEFDNVQDPTVFDEAVETQSDEEIARLLQEEEYSKFSM